MRRASRNSVLCLAMMPALAPLVVSAVPASQTTQARNAKSATTAVSLQAARAIAAIRKDRVKCQNAIRYAGPPELQACNSEASEAAGKLLRRSNQNEHLNDLLSDLSDPLMVVLTPDDERHDALSAQVVMSASYTDFAIARAALLTGAEGARSIRNRSAQPLFGWLGAKALSKDGDMITTSAATRRWQAIRSADCVRYPVPRCADRLDAVMGRMLRSITSSD